MKKTFIGLFTFFCGNKNDDFLKIYIYTLFDHNFTLFVLNFYSYLKKTGCIETL